MTNQLNFITKGGQPICVTPILFSKNQMLKDLNANFGAVPENGLGEEDKILHHISAELWRDKEDKWDIEDEHKEACIEYLEYLLIEHSLGHRGVTSDSKKERCIYSTEKNKIYYTERLVDEMKNNWGAPNYSIHIFDIEPSLEEKIKTILKNGGDDDDLNEILDDFNSCK